MDIKVEVVARVGDPQMIELMKRKPRDFNLRDTKSGVAVYLPSEDGIKYDVSPVLLNQELWMNINEGKGSDRFVTVVCSVNGRPIKPFWVKSKKNQREVDREIDARFSLRGSACVITVNKQGLFLIQEVWIESRYEYAEVKTEEIFSVLLKRNGGKFLFSESMFGRSCFKEAAAAAIRKANSPDGGGPMFFIEKSLDVIFHDETPAGMTLAENHGKIVISGGMTVRVNP